MSKKKKNKRRQEIKPSNQSQPLPAPVNRKRIWLSVFLIIFLGFLVYANALNGEFLLDDEYLVETNEYIRDSSNIPKMFTRDVGEGGGGEYNFYRPLQVLSYMGDYFIWKLNPYGYHLTNIILHIVAALALFWFVYALFEDHLLAALTSILFVVHPVHTEAVTYISGRTDPLSTVFILLTLILTIKAAGKPRMSLLILTILSYTIALLSREHSLLVPVLILLCGGLSNKKLPKTHFLAVMALSVLYIVLRLTLLKSTLALGSERTTFAERVPGFFIALSTYIRILLFPFNLHMEYGLKTFPFASLKVLLGVVLFFLSIFFIWKERKKHRLVVFSLTWFFIALLPVSNLYPLNAYMAEHWLYLPSVGFFVILAKGISVCMRRDQWKIPALMLTAVIIGFWSVLTVKQNTTWLEPMAFYKRTLRYAPKSSLAHNNLGKVYKENGNFEKAEEYHKKAIELDRTNIEALYNLGLLYADEEKIAEAEATYKKALGLKPTHIKALNNLAKLYIQTGQYEEAVEFSKKAIALKSNYILAHNNLAIAYVSMGKNREAIKAAQEGITLDPMNKKAYNVLGGAYLHIGEYEKALRASQKVVEIDPMDPSAHYNVGNIYQAMGRISEAKKSYQKVLALDPNNTRASENIRKLIQN